jgi:Fur family ferric uptake transcriptional regulator
VNFGDGQTRYEATSCAEHHDHLICNECGAIIEFEDPRIEQLQDEVARAQGFTIVSHRLEIFGLCSGCRDPSA